MIATAINPDISGWNGGDYRDRPGFTESTRAWDVALTETSLIAGGKAGGIDGKVGLHGPHHTFGIRGKLHHIQVNVWNPGVKGSGKVWRWPLPFIK